MYVSRRPIGVVIVAVITVRSVLVVRTISIVVPAVRPRRIVFRIGPFVVVYAGIPASTIWRWVVVPAFARRHHSASAEGTRPLRSRDRGLAMILRSPQLAIRSRFLHLLILSSDRAHMPFACRRFFAVVCTFIDSSTPSVVAHARLVAVHDRRVIHVVNLGHIDVVHRTVVVEMSAVPAPAFVSASKICVAVINAAIKSNLRSPI